MHEKEMDVGVIPFHPLAITSNLWKLSRDLLILFAPLASGKLAAGFLR
jgi:hypothetical protein